MLLKREMEKEKNYCSSFNIPFHLVVKIKAVLSVINKNKRKLLYEKIFNGII